LDITPTDAVWMDGMIRTHISEGVHDPLYARALVLANDAGLAEAMVIVSIDVCALDAPLVETIRQAAAARSGLAPQQIILAATHTHSGPATVGYFNPRAEEYLPRLIDRLAQVVADAAAALHPAAVGIAVGREETVSHYRRLQADDGHVVMNWEPFPPERIVGPLGVPDPAVLVLHVVERDDPRTTIATLFNHAGHPNVLSGENYLLSADYPGRAAELIEQQLGGLALFINGAQGSVDIDGLRDRDWEGRERIGQALAAAVLHTVAGITPSPDLALRCTSINYQLPRRIITEAEWSWAQEILAQTGGTVQPLADGVGDDYLAVLYRDLRARQYETIPVEQIACALGDSAFVTFPGEVYTEIGLRLKELSPFPHTGFFGLTNGSIGYIPTRTAIQEGGYAEDTRCTDAAAEEIVLEHSLAALTALRQT
jgi:hypothetical protein